MFRDPFVRRSRGGRSSWTEMERFQQEMNRLFSSTFSDTRVQTPSRFPAMNVWTNEEGVVVTAELPGVNAEDVDISVVNDILTVSGSRQPDELQTGERYHRRERNFGRFSRTFQLPFQVDTNAVDAMLEKGVLHVSLPRAESDKPRKIAIQSA
jgi:HSP20 family protein